MKYIELTLVTSVSYFRDGTEEIADEANSSFITCNRCEHSCSLEISCECKPHHGVSIVGLIVRSQARTLELYSNSDGYLQTARGKKVHEDGIFCCTSKLETPVTQINIKVNYVFLKLLAWRL
jgi:hypothetical protein